jgi:hypothetical protein
MLTKNNFDYNNFSILMIRLTHKKFNNKGNGFQEQSLSLRDIVIYPKLNIVCVFILFPHACNACMFPHKHLASLPNPFVPLQTPLRTVLV